MIHLIELINRINYCESRISEMEVMSAKGQTFAEKKIMDDIANLEMNVRELQDRILEYD